jgi:BMFP domain-containing protein YqiC
MLPHDVLLDFARQAAKLATAAAPPAASQQLQALAQRLLQDLDLVSRSEFDAQAAVLQRTRERLQQLENDLENLRHQLGDVNSK